MWGIFSFLSRTSLILLFCISLFGASPHYGEAATIHENKDTLSSSVPNSYTNHTLQFKTTVAIPPGGFVRFVPEPGLFTIPGTNLDHKNVELLVSTSSGYVLRDATSTADTNNDGITITPGTSGRVEVTLNSTVGIPAGAYMRLKIGDHTTLATSSDLGIQNPSATGSVPYYIEAGDGGTLGRVKGLVAILDQVTVGPIDTTEFIPPVRFNGAPTGTISGTTQNVVLSLETDEFAKCRYGTASGTPYLSIGNEFSSTFRVVHSVTLAVATNTTYTFYVRCIDDEGNDNEDDYIITFTVPPFPAGDPGNEGEEEGQGSGGGSGSGGSGSGAGSGGSNSSGGGGSGGGGGGGSSGTGSGGSGGGEGSGGFEGSDQPYQSGDGQVIITGYAFPRSIVTILVDGREADTVTADGSGIFSVTIDEIARGVYTFGVYATDRQGVRSSTFSTTFLVTGGRGSTLSNVNVMPSIKVSPDPITPGQALSVTGYAIPSARITIENQKDKTTASLKTFIANSDSSGLWSYTIPTDSFANGTYKIRAKAEQLTGEMVKTNYSGYTFYGVGENAQAPRSSDLNRDGKVNLIDFSILLFHWNTAGGNSNPPADINGDGKVSLTDFSIMIFNWTG